MSTIPVASQEAPGPVNHFGRLIGVFFRPKATFGEIAARPSWLAPILLLSIVGLGVGAMMNQRVDWGSFIRQQAEKNSRFAQLPEDQKERALGPQARFAPIITYVFGALGAGIGALILTLIYWGAFNLFAGAQLRFGSSFGIISHAFMPSAIASLLAILTLYLKKFGEADPQHLLASSLGAFLGSDAPKWLDTLGNSIEIFWIWCLALMAIGFSAANPKKVSTGKAYGIVFGLWLFWLVVKVGWAVAFS
jgi:hypothetical protein